MLAISNHLDVGNLPVSHSGRQAEAWDPLRKLELEPNEVQSVPENHASGSAEELEPKSDVRDGCRAKRQSASAAVLYG